MPAAAAPASPLTGELRRVVRVISTIALAVGEVVVKGAPDAVLPLCVDGAAADQVAALTEKGFRVLAVAGQDPPRSGVRDAIGACRRAGIRVAIATGDHPATAAAIGAEVGLREPGTVVLRGDERPTTMLHLQRP